MKGVDQPEQVHWRVTKMLRELEERLREQVLFSMEKRWFWEVLTAAFPHLQGSYQEDGAGLFGVVRGRQTRNKHKLKWKGLTRHKK